MYMYIYIYRNGYNDLFEGLYLDRFALFEFYSYIILVKTHFIKKIISHKTINYTLDTLFSPITSSEMCKIVVFLINII